jgi:two-component system, OmpR family, response regulator
MRGLPQLRVLCVDDNRDVADSTAELLGLGGFDAVACYGGAEALTLADSFAPDVCLIDLHMPGMDGDELARRLRARAGDRVLLLIAVTAQSDDEAHRRTKAGGFRLHCVKPLEPRDLFTVVGQFRRPADTRAQVAG